MHKSASASPYIYGLDAARFLCALMVAVFHLTAQDGNTSYMPLGWIGVQVFFVISGVVIANSAIAATPKQFAKSRFLRLYPAAWIATILNAAILAVVPLSAYQTLWIGVQPDMNAFIGSLTLFAGSNIASAYWTLPIELAFYFVVLISLFSGSAQFLRLIARALVLVSAAYLVLLVLSVNGAINAPWLDLSYGRKNALLVRHGAFFAIGIYCWMFSSRRPLDKLDGLLFATALCASVAEIYCRAVELSARFAGGGGSDTLGGAEMTVLGSLLYFGFVAWIFLSLRHAARWVPPGSTKHWLRTFGLMTYPFYLVHEAFGGAALHYGLAAGLSRPAALTISLVCTGIIAFVIARFAEPLLRGAISNLMERVPLLSSKPSAA